jgi:hypothetical protein
MAAVSTTVLGTMPSDFILSNKLVTTNGRFFEAAIAAA